MLFFSDCETQEAVKKKKQMEAIHTLNRHTHSDIHFAQCVQEVCNKAIVRDLKTAYCLNITSQKMSGLKVGEI